MSRSRRKVARAIGPITDTATGEILGWTYEWDTKRRTRLLIADLHPGFTVELDREDEPATPE